MKVLFLFFVFLLVSCNSETKKRPMDNESTVLELKQFPWTEEEMLRSKLYGQLLEFALFDSNKIQIVNEILCDTLLKNNNLSFSKIETKKGDSTYFVYYLHECENISTDYIGVLYLDFKNLDSICMYNFQNRFSFTSNDFMKILDNIAKKNKCSVEEIMKHRKLNNAFIPHFYFVVLIDSSSCSEGFVEGVKDVSYKINSIIDSCNQMIFGNDKIMVLPYMEFTNCFHDIIDQPVFDNELSNKSLLSQNDSR